MDRESTFLLALGMLIVAAAVVSASGWVLFVRDRRAGRAPSDHGRNAGRAPSDHGRNAGRAPSDHGRDAGRSSDRTALGLDSPQGTGETRPDV